MMKTRKFFGGLIMIAILGFAPFVLASSNSDVTNTIDNKNVLDLKKNLAKLEVAQNLEKNQDNLNREKVLRQEALFQIVNISLTENGNILRVVKTGKLDSAIAARLSEVIGKDNDWYQDFILKINLAKSIDELKSLALAIKDHRQTEEGLEARKLVGLVLTLEEIQSITIANKHWMEMSADLKDEKQQASLASAKIEIEMAYQLAQSSRLQLERIVSNEDFEYVWDWLKRANESLKKAYGVFSDLAVQLEG